MQMASVTQQAAGRSPDINPAVLLLDGAGNAVTMARSLSKQGIPVLSLNFRNAPVSYSRYVHTIELPGGDGPAEWEDYLTSQRSLEHEGAVLLACGDDGLEIVIRRRRQLEKRFILEEGDLDQKHAFLDKLSTYQAAANTTVAVPGYWDVSADRGLDQLSGQIRFPVMLKPRHSPTFARVFKRKYLLATGEDELRKQLRSTWEHGFECILMEYIPGPDTQLRSYHTYLDEHLNPLFEFTKQTFRRYPPEMGAACYSETDRNERVMAAGRSFLQQLGYQGLVNVEFKEDPRDGKLKLIECNARFTATVALMSAAGLDITAFVYNRLLNRPAQLPRDYTLGVRVVSPVRDFVSFLRLRLRRELTFGEWLRSVARPQTLPLFSVRDPMPALAEGVHTFFRVTSGALRRRDGDAEFRVAAKPSLVKGH